MMKIKFLTRIFPLVFLFFLILVLGSRVDAAATFSLSPSSQTVKVGDTLTITINFDTGTSTVNEVKALLSFPPSLLAVDTTSGIPDKPTVVTQWNRRLYSNPSGTIELDGNTNVSGPGQTLAVIRFNTKAVGTAAITFSQGSQISRSSDATNILSLTDSVGGNYNLVTTLPAPQLRQSTASQIPTQVGTTAPTTFLLLLSSLTFILGITLLRNSGRSF